ncbi:MAG TPA: YigZ family protein [Treponemataceae bacterium]|nr:YigZ family protein [Treponemataceae bacterium]
MKCIEQSVSCELEIKKSRFLAEAMPVSTQEEARSMLKEKKAQYAEASHVVHAFVIGSAGEILGCSDDGEPSGTAGRPLLDVLKGSGITNILVTVTRWFGGTLLGTGGLVKAYGDSVKAVLALAKTHEIIHTREFSVQVSYDSFDRISRELSTLGVTEVKETFSTEVLLEGRVIVENIDSFALRISDLTHGKAHPVFIP